jgi:hypothetical protein
VDAEGLAVVHSLGLILGESTFDPLLEELVEDSATFVSFLEVFCFEFVWPS